MSVNIFIEVSLLFTVCGPTIFEHFSWQNTRLSYLCQADVHIVSDTFWT